MKARNTLVNSEKDSVDLMSAQVRSGRKCRRCGAEMSPRNSGSVCWLCLIDAGTSFGSKAERAAATQTASSVAGTSFGDYILEAEIAHGGMGVVYRATQLSLARTVAVKLLLLGRFSTEQSVERFWREAKSAAALRHPNIVSIFEIGQCEGQHFFSMEFVEGSSLAESLRTGPISPRRAAQYTRAVAEAIQYAHSKGVLHRDLKPSNVLLDVFDQVRITDFGLAKKLDGSSDLTLTGQMIGSPNYLSPEAAAGRHSEVGPTSDVYSMGALLYELITGHPPFLTNSLQDTLLRVRDTEPVAPRNLNPRVPRDLETICLKCLNKDPRGRYDSAQLLADELDCFLEGKPILSRPATSIQRLWKWASRRPEFAAMVLATGLATLGIFVTLIIANARVQAARHRAELEREKTRQNLYAADIAAAHQAIDRGDPGLAHRMLAEHIPQHRESDLRGFEWQYLNSLTRGQQVDEFPDFYGQSSEGMAVGFSPDGSLLATGGGDGRVLRWRARRRQENDLGSSRFASGGYACVAARFVFSPNGCVAIASTQNEIQFLDGVTNPPIWSLATDEMPMSFSPDGRMLMTAGKRQSQCSLWEIASQTRIGDFTLTREWISLSLSPCGDRLAVAYRGKIVVWDLLKQRVLVVLPGLSGNWQALTFSPDGAYLAVTTENELPQYRFKLWDMITLKELSTMAHQNHLTGLAFSPDGKTLLSGSLDGTARLWEVPTGREILVLRGHRDFVRWVDWSPDGRTILTCSDDQTLRLWQAATGRALVILGEPFNEVIQFAAFSPTGDGILTTEGSERRLRLYSARGGTTLTPATSSSREQLKWQQNWERLRAIWRQNLRTVR